MSTVQRQWIPALGRTTLKIIAVISMICDHFAYIFVDAQENYPLYHGLRCFGRLAFPIFCFVLVQGFLTTKDVKKYTLRLAVFALLSEIPFDLAFFGTPFYPGAQNVFFTLLAGMLVLICLRKYEADNMASVLFTIAGGSAAYLLHTDYDFFGVLLIALLYILRQNKFSQFFWTALLIISQGGTELYAVLALPVCFLYSPDRRERRLPRYFFYAFYPLHLLVFILLQRCLSL